MVAVTDMGGNRVKKKRGQRLPTEARLESRGRGGESGGAARSSRKMVAQAHQGTE